MNQPSRIYEGISKSIPRDKIVSLVGRGEGEKRERRIKQCLWINGIICLEFDPYFRVVNYFRRDGLHRWWRKKRRKRDGKIGITFRRIWRGTRSTSFPLSSRSRCQDRSSRELVERIVSPTHHTRNLRVSPRTHRLTAPITPKDDLFSCRWRMRNAVGVRIVALPTLRRSFFQRRSTPSRFICDPVVSGRCFLKIGVSFNFFFFSLIKIILSFQLAKMRIRHFWTERRINKRQSGWLDLNFSNESFWLFLRQKVRWDRCNDWYSNLSRIERGLFLWKN